MHPTEDPAQPEIRENFCFFFKRKTKTPIWMKKFSKDQMVGQTHEQELLCLWVSQQQDGKRSHDSTDRYKAPYSCEGCSLCKGFLPRGFSEGWWTTQAEHFAVGPTSRFRKEGIFLTCSKVSHGLVVESEIGTICLARPSQTCLALGERR